MISNVENSRLRVPVRPGEFSQTSQTSTSFIKKTNLQIKRNKNLIVFTTKKLETKKLETIGSRSMESSLEKINSDEFQTKEAFISANVESLYNSLNSKIQQEASSILKQIIPKWKNPDLYRLEISIYGDQLNDPMCPSSIKERFASVSIYGLPEDQNVVDIFYNVSFERSGFVYGPIKSLLNNKKVKDLVKTPISTVFPVNPFTGAEEPTIVVHHLKIVPYDIDHAFQRPTKLAFCDISIQSDHSMEDNALAVVIPKSLHECITQFKMEKRDKNINYQTKKTDGLFLIFLKKIKILLLQKI